LIFNITIPITGYKEDKNVLNLVFNCSDSNCSNYHNNSLRLMNMFMRDFEIKHNETNPIITEESFDKEHGDSVYHLDLYDNSTLNFDLKILSIIYEDKQGISKIFNQYFNITTNFSFSYIEKSESYFNYERYENDSNIKFGSYREFVKIKFLHHLNINGI
jgi:hypothetical protein